MTNDEGWGIDGGCGCVDFKWLLLLLLLLLLADDECKLAFVLALVLFTAFWLKDSFYLFFLNKRN